MNEHKVELLRREDDEPVEAILRDELQITEFIEVEMSWPPARLQLIEALDKADVPINQLPQSLQWNWAAKAPQLQLLHAFGFGVICDGDWQGVMLVTTATAVARLPEDKGKPIAYIDYLEAAPWNWPMPSVAQDGRYKGVGSVLFRQAVQMSIDEGFRGRIGLHTLPQAGGFYENVCGMTPLGPDPSKRNLSYLELTAENADNYLAIGGRK